MGNVLNQVAIITGSVLGIGGATAKRLVESGAKVLITDINVEAAEANVERICGAGGIAEILEADVSRACWQK